MAAAAALVLVVLITAYHICIEARTRNIGHIPHLRELRLLVVDLAHILQEGVALTYGADGLRVVRRYAEHAHPVVTRTYGHNRHGHLVGRDRLLDEEAVDHLVQRAVAADDDNAAVTGIHRPHGKLRRVVLVLRKDQLVRYVVIAYELRYLGKVDQPAARSGHGIHYDEPLVRYVGCHLAQGHFSGAFSIVCIRKS